MRRPRLILVPPSEAPTPLKDHLQVLVDLVKPYNLVLHFIQISPKMWERVRKEFGCPPVKVKWGEPTRIFGTSWGPDIVARKDSKKHEVFIDAYSKDHVPFEKGCIIRFHFAWSDTDGYLARTTWSEGSTEYENVAGFAHLVESLT